VSGLYVFGLAGQKAASFVAAGHRIEFVKADDVYAAIERVSRPPAVSEETLRKQHEVVAHIAGRVEAEGAPRHPRRCRLHCVLSPMRSAALLSPNGWRQAVAA